METGKNSAQPRLLLTSICRPIGPRYGDAQSVGYELLHGQVTRLQGMFSPRAVHRQFSLDYIAENLDNPTVVLHYPSRRELIKELKKGYDYVGVSFIVVTFHRMKELVELVRLHSPKSKIILGGYGTVLGDDVLKPYGDHICRGEGVSFMRNLLGQPEIPMPYRHPVISSRLKVFSRTASYTGMIFAGLGCPNGCDFCSTSHFFKRRHIKLLPTGADIYAAVERHLSIDPAAQFTIIDEDFLLDRTRAMEFRQKVLEGGKPLSIFVFASVKALSMYTYEELAEMGVDGVWIGYEGERSGYGKHQGKPVEKLFRELREHGITILSSMILGFDYQTPEVISRELDRLINLRPSLVQFLIYNPTPGTPLYQRVISGGLLRREYAENTDRYYRLASGFKSMVSHPVMSPGEIEAAQKMCFERDYQMLGPSIYRVVGTWLEGYRKFRNSENPFLRRRAENIAAELRKAYPVFLPGVLFGPNRGVRRNIRLLEKEVRLELGAPTFAARLLSIAAVGAALWTAFTLKFNLFQHPGLTRNSYRMPVAGRRFSSLWDSVRAESVPAQLSVKVDIPDSGRRVRVSLEGRLGPGQGERLGRRIRESLEAGRGNMVLDMARLKSFEGGGVRAMCENLKEYRHRINISLPEGTSTHAAELLLAAEIFKTCGI